MRPAVECSIEDGVASVVINDGKVNVMTFEMLDALSGAIARARDADAMVILRSGSAKAFSAGFDVKALASGDADAARRMLKAGAQLLVSLLSHPRPVLAVCEGHAFPMGAFLLLASDIRIGVRGDYRIGLNEVAIGIPVPDFVLALVRSRVPANLLTQVATLGRMLPPAEALRAGFLDQLVEPPEIEAAISAELAMLRGVNGAAHASTKKRLRAATIDALQAAIDGEILPLA